MSNQPTHHVYFVKDQKSQGPDEKSKGIWTKIGAAWPHKDGKGFNLELELLPIGTGKLTVREVSEKPEASTQDQKAA